VDVGQPAGDSVSEVGSRIDSLAPGKRLWFWVFLISAGGFFEIYDLALTGPLSAALRAEGIFRTGSAGLFGLSDQSTFVFSTFFGLWLGVLAFSAFGDRLGRKPVFGYALLWYAAATLIMGLQSDAASICLWRLIAGIGLGAEAVAIDCYLVEIVPAHIRGRTFSISKSIQYCARPIGALLAALLVSTTILEIAGWRWLNVVPVFGAIGFAVFRRSLPESPRWLASKGRVAEAHAILDQIDLGRMKPGEAAAPARPTRRVVATRPYLRRVSVMIIIYFNLQAIAYYGFANWTPALLESKGVDLKASLFYTAGVALASPFAPLLLSLVSDRFERKHLILASGLLSVACGLSFAWSVTPAGWLTFGIGLAVFNAIISVNSHNYMSEIYPTGIRARAVGLIYSLTRISAAVSSFLIGYVLDIGGAKGVFALITGLMLVALAAVLLLGPHTRNVSVDDAPDP